MVKEEIARHANQINNFLAHTPHRQQNNNQDL